MPPKDFEVAFTRKGLSYWQESPNTLEGELLGLLTDDSLYFLNRKNPPSLREIAKAAIKRSEGYTYEKGRTLSYRGLPVIQATVARAFSKEYIKTMCTR